MKTLRSLALAVIVVLMFAFPVSAEWGTDANGQRVWMVNGEIATYYDATTNYDHPPTVGGSPVYEDPIEGGSSGGPIGFGGSNGNSVPYGRYNGYWRGGNTSRVPVDCTLFFGCAKYKTGEVGALRAATKFANKVGGCCTPVYREGGIKVRGYNVTWTDWEDR